MASKAGNQPEQPVSGQALAVNGDNGAMTIDAEFDSFFGSDSSDFGQADLSVPFIRIVQALSPCLQPNDEKYIEDAKQGQIIETVTPTLFDGKVGLEVIPVYYVRSYTEWATNRGGLVKDWGDDPTIMTLSKKVVGGDGKSRMITPDGNELSEAAQYFILYRKAGARFWEQAILTLSGTQWRTARDWNSNMARLRLLNSKGEPIKNPLPFAAVYHMTTVAQKKDNYNFYGWHIERIKLTSELGDGGAAIRTAAAFRKLAVEGNVKGDDKQGGDDIPFDTDGLPASDVM